MRIIGAFLLLLSLSFHLASQNNRYQFAHSYFGLENEILSQNGSFEVMTSNGMLSSKNLPTYSSTRLLIGGTHFWNHADFYISIPLLELALNENNEVFISNGVLTGFRVYPLKIKTKAVRPFLGIGFGSALYRQKGENGEGPTQSNRQWYYEAGVSYRFKANSILEIGSRYFNDKDYNYPISRARFEKIKLQALSFQLSYKRLFDFTQSYSRESTQKYLSKVYEILDSEKGLSSFSIGIGYSASIPLEAMEYSEKTPFLDQAFTEIGSPEFGVAYYLHKLDAATRISYRPLKQKESGYGYTTQLRTHALAFEAFKFIGDYHGFVPYVGLYVGVNHYNLTEKDNGQTITDYSVNKLAYGLIFGWDIRLSAVDYIILRTNLRYTPDFNYLKDGLSYTNNQLEFNFIQLVYYPQRHHILRNQH